MKRTPITPIKHQSNAVAHPERALRQAAIDNARVVREHSKGARESRLMCKCVGCRVDVDVLSTCGYIPAVGAVLCLSCALTMRLNPTNPISDVSTYEDLSLERAARDATDYLAREAVESAELEARGKRS